MAAGLRSYAPEALVLKGMLPIVISAPNTRCFDGPDGLMTICKIKVALYRLTSANLIKETDVAYSQMSRHGSVIAQTFLCIIMQIVK